MPVNNITQPLQEVAGLSENHFLGICRRSEKETKGTYKSYGMPECSPGECKKFMLFAVCISLPELNFIPSMESKHLLSFFFWQDTQSHGKAIQFSGLLPCLLCS